MAGEGLLKTPHITDSGSRFQVNVSPSGKVWTLTRHLLGSNLARDTDYPDILSPPWQSPDDTSLPNHLSSYHMTLHNLATDSVVK
jgi:hypothetical protein